jgi:hypothetical protein
VRTVEDLRERSSAAATAKMAARNAGGPADPLADARRERDGRLRAAADSAHAANLDLGVALINGLAVVDPADIHVARVFVLCGRRHRTKDESQVRLIDHRLSWESSAGRE